MCQFSEPKVGRLLEKSYDSFNACIYIVLYLQYSSIYIYIYECVCVCVCIVNMKTTTQDERVDR